MNSIFKLIVLTLLISNTFFTFFISYNIYNQFSVENQEEKSKINKMSQDYRKKINTIFYTNFIDSYNFVYAEINNINSSNILQTNTEILYNISYNCTILENESFETCNNLLKEVSQKRTNFIKTINSIKSSYDSSLGTIAFKSTTFDDFMKEIDAILNNIMNEKSFQTALDEYIQSLNNFKAFLDDEYTKSLETA
ncbi:MAG: hypothetical protein LBH40_04475 [Alphaproteobacteria bacterium]|jgi:hypothetical protein|nr:hypothetical protein [Alphaproteobacteria bacterium]